MTEARVAVVMINWNALAMTLDALATMVEHWRGTTWRAIVVDNGSTRGGSPDEITRRYPDVVLLRNRDNFGFSRACNQGARLSDAEYLLLLNNDTLQTEDGLTRAVTYMDAHPAVGALGIRHVDRSGRWQPSAFRFPHPSADVLALFGLSALARDVQGYAEDVAADVDWVCGSFLLIRRSCWDAVGELDERFFVYDEDIDWCLRAARRGFKVRYWPEAQMTHIGAASGATVRDKTFMHFRSRMTLYSKNQPLPWALAFYFAMSGRLTASTLGQVVAYARGRATREQVVERLRRQLTFWALRPTRAGVSRSAPPRSR